ncbi:hypothetical protein ACFWXK_22070 [Streptomyces sp. NPDC059070]|uniref:hypothetical protein n=1 Tax=Streptomyces sp. NPDC059070 TaxID=3346713 RepID=UPI0036D1A31E
MPHSAAKDLRRDVYAPPILSPVAGDVWPVGSTQTVTWDTSNPPQQITNPTGLIALSRRGRFVNGPGGLDRPLASEFSILDGHAEITVPDVAPGEYTVVLFGDSGNAGPPFSIVARR